MISQMAALFNVPDFFKKSEMDVTVAFRPHIRGIGTGIEVHFTPSAEPYLFFSEAGPWVRVIPMSTVENKKEGGIS